MFHVVVLDLEWQQVVHAPPSLPLEQLRLALIYGYLGMFSIFQAWCSKDPEARADYLKTIRVVHPELHM